MFSLSRKTPPEGKSPMVALAEMAGRMRDSGISVAFLTSGEPDFPTPRHVKEAAIIAIEQNFTRYTPNEGSPDLIRAIIKKFSLENNIQLEPDQILVSSGAKQCISNTLQAVCNKGDEVIIISPNCPDYPEMIRLADAVPVVVKTTIEGGFKPDVRNIRKAVNQRTKALLINSPNNPTGVVYSRSLLEEISTIVKDAGIYVISDEIYERLVYGESGTFSIGSLKGTQDQVITVNGVSMTFSMTGWRVGYMCGPRAVIERASRLQGLLTYGANSIAQKAALAALDGSASTIDAMVAEFKRRRDFAVEFLSGIRGVTVYPPQGGFFVFFGVGEYYGKTFRNRLVKNSVDLTHYLLEHHHVAASPGSAFGDDKCLRISYAYSMSELERGLERLKAGLDSLHEHED